VVEPDRQQPLSGHVLDTTMAATGAQVLIQVADSLGQSRVMGGQHRPAGRRIPQAIEDGDALGRAQHHVKAWDGVAAVGWPSSSPVVGSRPSNMAWNPATDASPCSQGWLRRRRTTVPGTHRDRTGTLVVGGQLAGVVGLPPHRELGDVGHHPASLLAVVGASECTAGALLSSENGLG
jgi:hypothetical protein